MPLIKAIYILKAERWSCCPSGVLSRLLYNSIWEESLSNGRKLRTVCGTFPSQEMELFGKLSQSSHLNPLLNLMFCSFNETTMWYEVLRHPARDRLLQKIFYNQTIFTLRVDRIRHYEPNSSLRCFQICLTVAYNWASPPNWIATDSCWQLLMAVMSSCLKQFSLKI